MNDLINWLLLIGIIGCIAFIVIASLDLLEFIWGEMDQRAKEGDES